MLEIEHVFKAVSLADGTTLHILSDVNLVFKSGTTTAIRGSSGSGKSTLLALMAALDAPTSGSVIFEGLPLHTLSQTAQAQFRAKHVGIVFQSFYLIPHYTALQNVWISAEIAKLSNPKKRAQEQLEKVGLGQRMLQFPHQLSGGEQQRVAVARATVASPRLLLCDEPTGNLDLNNAENIINLILQLQKETASCLVVVTHDPLVASRLEQQVVLQKGEVVAGHH